MTLFIAYILNIIDHLFTHHWINLYGIDIEGNPFGRWLFENNVAFSYKFILMPILLAVLGYCIQQYPKAVWVAFIPLVVYGLIDVYHLAILIYTNFILN